MSTLSKGAAGAQVQALQELLKKQGLLHEADGIFGLGTEAAVKEFQKMHGLTADGIVGAGTWGKLQPEGVQMPLLTEEDMQQAANQLGIELAALKAVRAVETGGRSGFLADGKPVILFEGHIFWKQLKQKGINPESHVAGNEDILYPSWTTAHYKRGALEHDRLNRAMQIHQEAAMASASWGLFQIMGFNYQACGFSSVSSYVEAQHKNEREQLFSFIKFLSKTPSLPCLKAKDWAGFARHYNGPAYAQNKYDQKLMTAYQKYSQA